MFFPHTWLAYSMQNVNHIASCLSWNFFPFWFSSIHSALCMLLKATLSLVALSSLLKLRLVVNFDVFHPALCMFYEHSFILNGALNSCIQLNICLCCWLYAFNQQLKRKSETADYEAESSDRTTGPGVTEVVNNHLQTPVSVKGGKANKTSRLTKCTKSGPLTPVSNVGE